MGLFPKIEPVSTGHALADELATTLDSIHVRALDRQADVDARLAELEAESRVLSNVARTTERIG